MGFFGTIGKVLAGKPVYSPQNQATQNAQSNDGQSLPQQPGKIIPMIRFGRVENQWDGPRLAVYADAENESAVPVFLDWIIFNGAKRQLDMQLRPGEVRQLLIFTGPLLQNRPGGYVELQYRTAETGDYFMNYHEIRTEQQGEFGFRVTELLQRGPVKDLR